LPAFLFTFLAKSVRCDFLTIYVIEIFFVGAAKKNRETEGYNHFSWLFVVRALQFPFLRLSLLLIYSVFTQFVCAIAFVIVFPLPHGKISFLQFSSNPFETGENCLGARFSNYGLCVSQV